MDLQEAFYIIGIVFMSLMLLITIALAIAIFVIKKKIDEMHRKVDEKLAIFGKAAHLGSDIVDAAKKAVKLR